MTDLARPITTRNPEPTKPTQAPRPGYVWKRNLMSREWYQEAIDTPYCCSPSTETYWSM